MKILLTGGTGFLGLHAMAHLESMATVHVLSRSAGLDLCGDLTKWNAGLNLTQLQDENYDILIHLAALYDLQASALDCYKHNLFGTTQALKIAQTLKIPRFVNASSVAAAINLRQDVISPLDLNLEGSFPDAYAESKALVEKVVQNWHGVPLKLNLRFGVLVGDTEHGFIERIDGAYSTPKIFKSMKTIFENSPVPVPLPGRHKTRLPFVPVDVAAQALAGLTQWLYEQKGSSLYKSFHVTPFEGVSLSDFYRSVLSHCKIKSRRFLLSEKVPSSLVSTLAEKVGGFPKGQIDYLLQFAKYDSEETMQILGRDWCPEFSSYEKIFWSGYEKFISNR